MGKQTPGGQEVAHTIVSGQFTGTGRSGNATRGTQSGSGSVPPVFKDLFNAALWGTFVGTVKLEKSFDGGTTWLPVSKDIAGNEAAYTAPVNLGIYEPEPNILYSWNCTSYVSGTINYRLSQ